MSHSLYRSAAALAFAGALAVFAVSPALAQRVDGPAEIPVETLMKATGDLPEIAIGPADAKITIVEFASLSCSHCRDFHKNVLPQVKAKYVDTGKVRIIMRDHPGNDRAVAGAMLARCAGDKASSAHRRSVQDTGAVGLPEGEPVAEAPRNRQAGGLH